MCEDFLDFIILLNKHKQRYVLVGDWAVIFKGYSRTTGDIDFLIDRTEENINKLLFVMKEFIGSNLGFSKTDFLEDDNVII